jgi:signal transduction histidine kinase
MQQGAISFNPVELVLLEIVSRNISLLCQRSEQKGVDIISEIPEKQSVYADEEMLNSILRNLLSNAIKFTNRGGKVRVYSNEKENNIVEIAIQDSGIGMSESLSKKLFRMEEEVGHTGTEGEKSTGLGFLLCKEFIERHGGKIWVDSREKIGSTFYFTLPQFKNNSELP